MNSTFISSFPQWVPEISHHCPRTPFLLVGTQVDLREDSNTIEKLAKNKQRPLYPESGEKLARELKAVKYVECSALTQVWAYTESNMIFVKLGNIDRQHSNFRSLSFYLFFSTSEGLRMCLMRPSWRPWSLLRPKPRESACCYRWNNDSEKFDGVRNGWCE